MRKSVAIALCAVAGMAMASAPEANAQSKKKAAAPAPAAQWTDCSKVDAAKRDVCIRSLPTVKGPVPVGGSSAAAAAAPAKDAKAAAPAKDVKKAEAPAKDAKAAAPAASSGINPNSPCAKVEAAKRDACLSRAPASKGPGWAAFSARPAPTAKK